MANCCNIEASRSQKKRILIAVLVINAIMFFAQLGASIAAHSSSLLADSFDMLGDALTYSLSLYAVSRGGRWLAKAALFKGGIILVFAAAVLLQAIYKMFTYELTPLSGIMFIFSLLGLGANLLCLYLLTSQKDADINMRSTWICSRNDIVGNVAVLVTAALVFVTHSRWPDIIVAFGFVFILLRSGVQIIRDAVDHLKEVSHPASPGG